MSTLKKSKTKLPTDAAVKKSNTLTDGTGNGLPYNLPLGPYPEYKPLTKEDLIKQNEEFMDNLITAATNKMPDLLNLVHQMKSQIRDSFKAEREAERKAEREEEEEYDPNPQYDLDNAFDIHRECIMEAFKGQCSVPGNRPAEDVAMRSIELGTEIHNSLIRLKQALYTLPVVDKANDTAK